MGLTYFNVNINHYIPSYVHKKSYTSILPWYIGYNILTLYV
jgi:hypothetical protein